MFRRSRALLAAAVALALLLSLTGRPQPAAAATRGDYTILVFMNGSDLESQNGGAATRDLAEMVPVGSSDEVNVLVETLGTASWTPSFIASDRNQRWRVEEGRMTLVDDTVGRRDLADPATLRDFIIWGMENYPAERYALILWNHGGGSVYGFGLDETNLGNPSLSLEGIARAIGEALAVTEERFELIGFDSCLLATAELAALISPYGRYMVASEELEPGHGWDYTPVLQAVRDQPDITGDRLGQVIAEQYRAQAGRYGTDKALTLSVIDLARMPALVTAWDQFLAAIAPAIAEEPGLRQLQRARRQAGSYGGAADMVDLYDLVHKAAPLAPDEAELLLDRIREAVVYNMNSIATPRAAGLSIYFPDRGRQFLEARLDRYATTGFSAPYQAFLPDYVAAAFTGEPVELLAAAPVGAAVGSRGTQYAVQVNPEHGSRVAAVYSIMGMVSPDDPDDTILLFYDNDVDFNPETGEIADTFLDMAVTLNGHYAAMYLEEEGERYDRYSLPIELNGQDVTLIVLYDWEADADLIVGAWPGLDPHSQMAQRELILVEPGDRIRPLFEFYNQETGETGHYEGDEFVVEGELQLGYTDLPAGTYLYGFLVVDFAGNESYSEFTEVEVIYTDEEEPDAPGLEPDRARALIRQLLCRLPWLPVRVCF